MKTTKGRQLYNRFVRRDSFTTREYFEDEVVQVKAHFQRKYPNALIEDHRNKNGTRIIVYEKK